MRKISTRLPTPSAHPFYLSAAQMHRRRAVPAGGAFYVADKQKKCAEKVNKRIIIGCIVSIVTVEGKGLNIEG